MDARCDVASSLTERRSIPHVVSEQISRTNSGELRISLDHSLCLSSLANSGCANKYNPGSASQALHPVHL